MLIRKNGWSSDVIMKSHSKRCHTQQQPLYSPVTRVRLQKQLTNAFKGLSHAASPCHLLHQGFDINAYCENTEAPHSKHFTHKYEKNTLKVRKEKMI